MTAWWVQRQLVSPEKHSSQDGWASWKLIAAKPWHPKKLIKIKPVFMPCLTPKRHNTKKASIPLPSYLLPNLINGSNRYLSCKVSTSNGQICCLLCKPSEVAACVLFICAYPPYQTSDTPTNAQSENEHGYNKDAWFIEGCGWLSN